MAKPLDTMTVGELKAYLEEFPDSCKVGFAYPSGDYWHTQLVGPIKSAEYGTTQYIEYHRKHQLVTDEDATEDDREDILILGG